MELHRDRCRRGPSLLLAAGLCLLLAGPALAAGKAAKGATAKASKHKKSPKSPSKSSKPAKPAATLAEALAAVRAHLAEAGRKGKPSDLATMMIGGLMELGFVQAIHGHYALAGVGQSYRSGAMAAPTVQLAARDMERNYGRLIAAYSALAAQDEFKGQLAGFFAGLSALCGQAQEASAALVKWTEAKDDGALAAAFEARLEAYRKAVSDFARTSRGG